ncbi:complex I subunit 5 family protein [Actinomycetospora sp.]|uniref:complex I subunit 5 family protein n=1 Tax=Actinomycetospora sp. TaxID=1872135 RepID=UPI002F3EFDD4
MTGADVGRVDVVAPLAVTGPVLLACLVLVIGRWAPRPVVDALALVGAAALACCGGLLVAATSPGDAVTWLGGWAPAPGTHPVGIALVADPAAGLLVLLVGTLAAGGLLFSWRYFASVEARFQALVLLFCAGMTGFVLAGDLFTMLVFFELMGAVAYALAAYKIEEPRSLQGGLTFGVVNSLGAYLALCGVGVLYARTGQLNLAFLGETLAGAPPDGPAVVGVVLVLVGWLVKAAAVPFHFWLADAHAVAPTPVCVLFSGVMAPLGVYGVARVTAVVAPGVGTLAPVLVVVGTVTAVLGTVLCVVQRNLKRLLAYSTIAHVGLFLIGAADGGSRTWLVYLAGHAGVKAALFLLVGVLLARFGSVDEIDLHGAARTGRAPDRLTGALFLLAGLALAGLPPVGAGLGKAALEESVPGVLVPVVVGVSVVTAAAVLRAGLRVFLGVGPRPERRVDPERTSGEGEEREMSGRFERVPTTMLAAPTLLLAAAVVVGTLPLVGRVGAAAGERLADGTAYRASVLGPAHEAVPVEPVAWHLSGVVTGLGTTVAAVVLALVVLLSGRVPARRRRPVRRAVGRIVLGLERLHSGHVGDYVAWLLFGAAVIGIAVAAPTLG